ncbi:MULTISPECIES: hypothetical protein [Streptosporangium]|uniref:Uncharacterized protein n=1 Tax=Streptosporangium brasiliense TaxID=47480 RepID=A0ABT9RMB5_9ACTN|nr:hypothetical protein [Streptosporangium brasiliense]MDP9870434.1 hypothetical protein [Streptosporangium brasiliense]
MPGPCSTPKALAADGRILDGKSALSRAGAKSGEGMDAVDYNAIRTLPPVAKDLPPKARAKKAVADRRNGL